MVQELIILMCHFVDQSFPNVFPGLLASDNNHESSHPCLHK